VRKTGVVESLDREKNSIRSVAEKSANADRSVVAKLAVVEPFDKFRETPQRAAEAGRTA
jgi:DNA-binding IclR family transcriptional regulator